jgi:hypothetical protein
VPEVVDLLGLGEEAVAAEVEAVPVADLGLGDATDLVLGLEDDDRLALLGEAVAGGQPRGPSAQHGDGRRGTIGAARRVADAAVVDQGHGASVPLALASSSIR